MKLLALTMAAALTLAACGGATTSQASPTTAPTTAPTATPAPTPNPLAVFKADLLSAEAVPPFTDAEASCSGSVTITIDRTANKAKFEIQVKGCPATTAVNLGMIHEGAKGVAGPVRFDATLKAGELALAGGAGSITKDNVTGDAAVIANILANPGGFFFQLHSTAHPPSLVRGQLQKV